MKKKVSFAALIRKNKEELLRDKAELDKIEKRLEAKYEKAK